MEMCETCQEAQQLGLLPADSLASLSVLPGSKEAQQMTVTSGRKWLELLNVPGQLGYWLRMCLESSAWNSTRCYLTWNVSATPHGRLLFLLVPSMPRTDGSGFGLWPTPTTQDASNNGGPSQLKRNTLPLNAAVTNGNPSSGSLNPTWIEWLMGYPQGWTDLED